LRLSSIDSIEADDEMVEVITGDLRVMPHLHLSLQSGDNMILKRMKRRHSREHTIEFCNLLRDKRPDMVFGADIIAGFPTETDEMFENSMKIVDECGLTYLHVFPYSSRPDTPAAKMPMVEQGVIKRRAAMLRTKGEARLESFLSREVGASRAVLVETPAQGRTEHFALAKFETAMVPGAVVQVQVQSASSSHLHVGM
jgi:threonylcarbamoyladenosine tRNA methylthiotransferase MtaB